MVVYPNDEEARRGSHRFLEFVDKTLALLSNSHMKKFSLSRLYRYVNFPEAYDHGNRCLSRLICTALERGLLELHLHANPRSSVNIETELLTSKTLVKLTLSGAYSLEVERETMATSYPFPDNVHVTSSVTLKLTDSNYLLWKTQFESLLSSQKLIGFVNGTVNAPSLTRLVVNGEVTCEEPNPLYEAWFCTDQLIRSWLFGTLSEEVLGHVHNLSTSRQIWVSLAENFNKSSVAREFSLRRSLQLLSKKEKPFSVYYREFKTICDALSSIGKPVDEQMKIFGFLNGLGHDYDPITTVIQSSLNKLPSPTFNDVVSEVQGFDTKLQSYEETTSVTPHLAFNTERSTSGAPQYNPNQKGQGRSGQNKGRGGYSSRGRGFSQHQSSPQASDLWPHRKEWHSDSAATAHEEGVDYLETFSPVVRTATIRLVLDVATTKSWPLKQLDVSNAFLHGELHEPVFMYQPTSFVDSQKPNHVCRLTKALYGLKQAPRAWFDTFSNFLLDLGFVCSKSDPSLFVCLQDGKTLYLLLYVDDILLTGSDQSLLEDLLKALNNRFSMKDLAYASEILHQAGMSDCNPMPTPLPQQLTNINSEPFEEQTYFRSLPGKLQYLFITRPDIQYAVNFICQRMHFPTVSDFGLLKRILRYIKGTLGMGLPIKRNSELAVSGYSDSDWAGCKSTRRSTTGFCILLGSNLISWSAKRQPTVSNSSTEAEYRALTFAAREITWISLLLRDLGVSQYRPTQVFYDNLSAVYLSANPALHNRSKHFDTDYHYIREQVALGLIETNHILAITQLADIFTKPLPRRAFIDLRTKLGVSGSPTPSLREGKLSNSLLTYSRLINGCSVLEELYIRDSDHCGLDVQSASIKRLVVFTNLPDFQEDHDLIYFETPNLVYLDYSSYVSEDYQFTHLDSLVEVSLSLRLWESTYDYDYAAADDAAAADDDNNDEDDDDDDDDDDDEDNGGYSSDDSDPGYSSDDEPRTAIFGDVTNLVAGISHITTLHLSLDSLEAFHFCYKSMPMFNNLLTLCIESNKDKGWQVMPLLLKSCPNLHTLVLKGLVHRVTNRCGDACACIPKKQRKIVENEEALCCLWTCQVKVLEILDYGGSFQELQQIRHFLGKLECLETVKVVVDDVDNYKGAFLRASLLTLPRVSSNCRVQFN
ncbi:Retrotransposon Copia-like N-terminal [Arabidopsis suecica]|uniref:Retrotransposon Copia-like N-terminal n=1 Tax=Arabidopsis suecica TaxID=45249 RepID=A0A8T2HDN0_ARASU|nr:Retrotransposon Copia-like N-terminal [Arabidopsis suecica]